MIVTYTLNQKIDLIRFIFRKLTRDILKKRKITEKRAIKR